MESKSFKRKLTAILITDVVGYSRLMRDDEETTVQTLNAYKQMIFDLIERNRGRLVDSTGDNLLAEFASVVDAMRCAVQIQEDLKIQNNELPENRKMEFRIGINLGDVIQETDRIYGDGVNVAARIESLADAGGICVSRTAYDQVKRKLNLRYEYLGEHQVKNIDEPVRVYKVLLEPLSDEILQEKQIEECASEEREIYPQSDKTSIAILPFINMSGDPEQDYFSDGITEDIITDLSKVSGIFVIARNSSFLYRGKHVKVQQVAEEPGVSYVLEGSVRRGGDRLHINVQLIDANTGHHLWAERYDRELKDIFSVQDEVTQKVVSELAVTLTADESERLDRKHINNFEAYELFLRARSEAYSLKKENYLKSIELCEMVIELDANFGGGYAWLALMLGRGVRYGFSTTPSQDIEKAFLMAQKAVSVDEFYGGSYFALADAYMMIRKHDDAIATVHKALRIQPGDALSYLFLGWYLHWAGRGEEAIEAINRARQLDPRYLYAPHPAYLDFMGLACFTGYLYEEVITNFKKSIDRFGPEPARLAFVIASYSELNREEEAINMVQQLIKADPKFSPSTWSFAYMYKNPKDTDRLLNALQKAGLK